MTGSHKASHKAPRKEKVSNPLPKGVKPGRRKAKEKSSHKRGFALLALVTVACLTVVGFTIFKPAEKPPLAPILPVASAAQFEQDAAELCEPFEVQDIACQATWEFSDTQEVGALIKQSPESGTRAKEVTLIYSKGPENVTVPVIAGSKVDNIELTLWAAGLTVGTIAEEDSISPPGTIVGASVEPAEEVANGTAIDLTVSTGEITVPNWLGKTQDFVTSEANNLGLQVTFEEVKSDKSPGLVIAQTPKNGKISKDTTVTVKISVAENGDKVAIPDIIGLSQIDAISQLASVGFIKIKTLVTIDPKAKQEKVTEVSPKVGEEVDPNQTITITVSRAS